MNESTQEATNTNAVWPSEPYKGIAFFGINDRPLFSGRDREVDECVHRLASARTRILLLHGNTGCGKSSFLRAGLIPRLEESGFGYYFLRDVEGIPLFIRCGPDPIARIAEQLFRFASGPTILQGMRQPLDLSAARLDCKELSAYVEACRDPDVLLESLHAISERLPYTLVIIVDQAEEVITLGEASPVRQREFFSFIKEFSSINFPVKFVLALRKDHSGVFIERALEEGAVDLRKAVFTRESDEQTDRGVKSEIKLFLLSELDSDAVLHAIKLPTSREPVSTFGAPYDRYGFEYAPGVAEAIVKDLFDTRFTAAVLPVMQIVCRDLYNGVRPKEEESEKPRPWIISMKQYVDGGRITGPVDRHISTFLRASFGTTVEAADIEAEERRWREILFRLVRRESDGTTHTRIVDFAELRGIAADAKAHADVDKVVAYLIQPNVLLLRAVTSLSATNSEARKLSLGHDFIAMVLHQWKLGAEQAEIARKREAELRKWWMLGTIAVAIISAVMTLLISFATNAGKAEQTHEVLLNTVQASQRSELNIALVASAHAMTVADDVNWYQKWYMPWKKRDLSSDNLLAHLVAGLPDTQFASTADSASFTFPLPKSVGFVNVNGDQVVVSSKAGNKNFDLEAFSKRAQSAPSQRTFVSEVGPGILLLMRTSSYDLIPALESTMYQVYVLPVKGKLLGPFDRQYFLAKLRRQEPKPSNDFDTQSPTQRTELAQLELHGGSVVLVTSKPTPAADEALVGIDSVLFDPNRSPQDPFARSANSNVKPITYDASVKGVTDRAGLPGYLFLDKFLVVPKAFKGSQQAGPTLHGLDNHDLESAKLVSHELKVPRCENQCEWQWILRADAPNRLLVFGAPHASRDLAQRSYNEAVDIGDFRALWILDVVTGTALELNTKEVTMSLASCAGGTVMHATAPEQGSPQRSGGRMFITGALGSLLLGIVRGHSIDVLRVVDSHKLDCVGTLFFMGEFTQWVASEDGGTLLGVGESTGAAWSIGNASVRKKEDELRAEGKLYKRACEKGLKYASSHLTKQQWTTATHLLTPPNPMCQTE